MLEIIDASIHETEAENSESDRPAQLVITIDGVRHRALLVSASEIL